MADVSSPFVMALCRDPYPPKTTFSAVHSASPFSAEKANAFTSAHEARCEIPWLDDGKWWLKHNL